jgi:hypothetical protein
LSAGDHALTQFGFGLKRERLGDVDRLSARQISAPVLRHIQLAINESMAQSSDVAEKDAHLTILDLAAHATILRGHGCGVLSAFGKATFIEHQQGEGSLLRWGVRGEQALFDQSAQLIADGVLIPDGLREQALHARGGGFSRLFGDLPAIFAWDITEDGLQVAQSILVDFATGEMRT